MDRIRLYPKDIQILLGISRRQSFRHYDMLMHKFKKTKPQILTLSDFAHFHQTSLAEIEAKLKQ